MGIPLDLRLLKRRAEMLDAISSGLHPAAVIAQLAGKYGVNERALWSDVAAATTVEGAKELLAKGFDYILEKNNIMLFKRPKRFNS